MPSSIWLPEETLMITLRADRMAIENGEKKGWYLIACLVDLLLSCRFFGDFHHFERGVRWGQRIDKGIYDFQARITYGK